jgi:hypothetical protein
LPEEDALITDWKFTYKLSPKCAYTNLRATEVITFTVENDTNGDWVTGFVTSISNSSGVEATAKAKNIAKKIATVISEKVGNTVSAQYVGSSYKLLGHTPERWMVSRILTTSYHIFKNLDLDITTDDIANMISQDSTNKDRVFISYAREDAEAANRLYDDLAMAGLNPWLDTKSLLAGQNWKIIIKDSIRNSRYFIALLSSNSIGKRGYVQKELKEALEVLDEFPESQIFMIPVRLNDCNVNHSRVNELHRVDLFPNWEEGFKRILVSLRNDDKK